MYSSLERVDLVSTTPDGQRQYRQTDHRTAAQVEEEPALSVLFAIVRILGAVQLARQEPDDNWAVIYTAAHPPPEFLRQAVQAAGGLVSVGRELRLESGEKRGTFLGKALRTVGALFGGRKAEPAPSAGETPTLDAIIQRAFADLAREVAAEHGVGLDVDGLRVVEDALAARELDPDADEIAYWTAVFQLGAFGGEVLRGSNGGRWVQAEMGSLPLALSTRYGGKDATVNPLGKAIKRFSGGEGDRVASLVDVIRGNP
jgi:hypothetical protein